MSVGSLVTSGPLILAVPVAAAAGAVTFLSPCCLPLVPGYLSYVTGMSAAGTESDSARLVRATSGARPRRAPAGAHGARAGPAGAPAAVPGPAAPQPGGRGHGAVRARVLGAVHLVRGGVRQLRNGTANPPARRDARARRADDRPRPAVRRPARPVLVRRADYQAVGAPARRDSGRAAARRAVRARLDPLHRPDADRGAGTGLHNGHRGPRRVPGLHLLPRPRRPVHHRGAGVPARHALVRIRQAARAAGDRHRRRHVGRGRPARGDRRVVGRDHLAADPLDLHPAHLADLSRGAAGRGRGLGISAAAMTICYLGPADPGQVRRAVRPRHSVKEDHMRFGIFYEHQLPRTWGPESEHTLLSNALEQVELADRSGLDYVWEVEHHFLEEYSHSSAPEVFLAAASQRTRRIRLGHGIVQAPSAVNHPARIAERVAT